MKSEPKEAKGSETSMQNEIMFVEEDHPIEEEIPWHRSRDLQMKKRSLSSNGCKMRSMSTIKRNTSRRLL